MIAYRSNLKYQSFTQVLLNMCKLGSFIPSYLSVRYEDFVAHPVPTISKIYKFMGIPFTDAHRNAVEESVE